MTRKVFWEDPYLCELEARVTGIQGDDVTLDRTIFYALSGGQESDRGTIGGRPVLQARLDGQAIFCALEPGDGLRSGDVVTIEIDWERRYRLMRLHFAAELVLELVKRELRSVRKLGAHIAEDKARIDFQWDTNMSGLLPGLTEAAQAIVASDEEITSAFSDESRERRYWKIREFALVPCGGTHLRRTGEIGAIQLKRKNVGKGKERIEIYLRDGTA